MNQNDQLPVSLGGPRLPVAGALLLATGPTLFEAVVLNCGADSIYQEHLWTVTVALVGIYWFWFTVIVAVPTFAEIGRRTVARWPRWAARFLWATILSVLGLGAVAYLTSWGLYFRAGRFANVEALRFAAENVRTSWLWSYILTAERQTVWRIMSAAVVTVTGAFLIARMRGSRPRALAGLSWGNSVLRATWYALTLIAELGLLSVQLDPIQIRRELALDALMNRVNPALTLAASVRESLFDEGIDPCIDEAELTPIAANSWRVPDPHGPYPSIILVGVESLRHDVLYLAHQDREVTPNLNALARSGVRLTRAYAPSTHSDYSDVSVLASLYPLRTRRHHYYRAGDPWPKTLIYDLLKPAGYATAIISSQNESWGGMDQFLISPNLDFFYDAARAKAPTRMSARDSGFAEAVEAGIMRAGSLDDAHTVDVAIAWLNAQARQQKPFFLSMNLQSPHFPYDLAPEVPRPFQPATIDFAASFLYFPPERTTEVRNAYYNAVQEADRQLGRLLEALRANGSFEKAIVVVYGDNGEAFHENGSVTHAREPVEPAVHVACVVHAAGRLAPREDEYPFELIDIPPTLLGLLGWPPHPNFQGMDALAPDRVAASQRAVFLHVENGLSRADAVLFGGRWKLHHDRNSKREQLFDVLADPGETTNLVASAPEMAATLRGMLSSWRAQQLAYYHFPSYYEFYYPPRPPRVPPMEKRGTHRATGSA